MTNFYVTICYMSPMSCSTSHLATFYDTLNANYNSYTVILKPGANLLRIYVHMMTL